MKVLFFASLRDTLGTSELQEPLATGESLTADGLRERLKSRGEAWQKALSQPSLLVAVNQAMVPWDTLLSDDDEVALFPPVTGG
ncbi:MoaD/ThiS family protein [Corallincola platygyrae]|uniref:Molybdopterin synthase sulfur carrier subunit n=1 Tax=Corallincola platygyrae TaxID=1193278 RepID=A0ABW4XPJ0_9GAMM